MAKKINAKEEAIVTNKDKEIAAIEAEPDTTPEVHETQDSIKTKFDLRAFLKTKKGKLIAVAAGSALLIGLVFAVPLTRYAILGTFIKKPVTVTVLDSVTNRPVSEANIEIGGTKVTSDASGQAKLSSVPVGNYNAKVTKSYYTDASEHVLVAVFSDTSVTIKIQATGRQVPVKVLNKISGKPVSDSLITAGDSSAKTDANGEAVIVLPADKATVWGTVKTTDYNELSAEVVVTDKTDAKNTFAVVPYGHVYFLSKRTGKINVMKSDLDGDNQKVVLEGTGKESDGDTVLLASRDWKNLALKARRDSDKAKLYYINADNDKLSVIDEGNAEFNPVGWSDNYFVYSVDRGGDAWANNKVALKSFNAATAKLQTLDQTTSEDIAQFFVKGYQQLASTLILNQKVVYVMAWTTNGGSQWAQNKKTEVRSIKPDGQDKKVLKTFDATNTYFSGGLQVGADDAYYAFGNTSDYKVKYYELNGSNFADDSDMTTEEFNRLYGGHLVSPSGQYVFWLESRDGKNFLIVGDSSGENGQTVLSDDKLSPYGWYSDSYLLMSKNSSELYIVARDGAEGKPPTKVTDYHRAYFPAYGYGYGGGY